MAASTCCSSSLNCSPSARSFSSRPFSSSSCSRASSKRRAKRSLSFSEFSTARSACRRLSSASRYAASISLRASRARSATAAASSRSPASRTCSASTDSSSLRARRWASAPASVRRAACRPFVTISPLRVTRRHPSASPARARSAALPRVVGQNRRGRHQFRQTARGPAAALKPPPTDRGSRAAESRLPRTRRVSPPRPLAVALLPQDLYGTLMVEGGRRIVGATHKHRQDQRSESRRQSALVARLHHQHLGEQTRPVPRIQKLAGTGRAALPPSDQVAQHGLPRSKTRQKLGQMPLLADLPTPPPPAISSRRSAAAVRPSPARASAASASARRRASSSPCASSSRSLSSAPPASAATSSASRCSVFHFPAQKISVLQGPRARGLQLEDLVLEVILLRRRGPVGRQGGLKLGLLPTQDGAHELQSALVGRERGRLFGPSGEHSELTPPPVPAAARHDRVRPRFGQPADAAQSPGPRAGRPPPARGDTARPGPPAR